MVKKNTYTKEIDKHLSDNILYLRLRKGVTQKTVATDVDVSIQQFQKYESGRNRVTIGRLVLIARALGEPVETFYKNIDVSPIRPKTEHQKICEELRINFLKIRNPEQLRIINALVNSLIK